MSLTPGVPLEFKAKVYLELKEAKKRALLTIREAPPKEKKPKPKPFDDALIGEMYEIYLRGSSLQDLATIYDTNHKKIYATFQKRGLKVRTPIEASALRRKTNEARRNSKT